MKGLVFGFGVRGLAVSMATCALLVVAGCGGGTSEGGPGEFPEEKQITNGLIINLPGAAADSQEQFAEMFLEGSAPSEEDRAKYAELEFKAASVNFSGDTATVEVEVKDLQGNAKGTVTWEAAKAKNDWRLKSAPLP